MYVMKLTDSLTILFAHNSISNWADDTKCVFWFEEKAWIFTLKLCMKKFVLICIWNKSRKRFASLLLFATWTEKDYIIWVHSLNLTYMIAIIYWFHNLKNKICLQALYYTANSFRLKTRTRPWRCKNGYHHLEIWLFMKAKIQTVCRFSKVNFLKNEP